MLIILSCRVKDELFAWRVKEGTAAEELFVQPQFDETGRAFVEVELQPISEFTISVVFLSGGGEEENSTC